MFSSLGQWTVPTISGQTCPATSDFVIEKINDSKAVMFGGLVNDGDFTDSLYTCEVSQTTLVSVSRHTLMDSTHLFDIYLIVGNFIFH